MENSYQVYVKPTAIKRLAAHVEFLARVSEDAALLLIEDYYESLKFLEGSPKSCPVYIPKIHIDTELRYKLFGKRYRIVFEIVEKNVYALDIQDCRQDFANNLI